MKYLIGILFILIGLFAKAQQRYPTGFPSQFNTGYNIWGYARSDSGLIVANRDTNWLAKYSGTVVFKPSDRKFYYFDSTLLRWFTLSTDTTSLSNRINLRLNISDTSSMLSPYLRKIDTTNKWVTAVRRLPGSLNVEVQKGGVWTTAYTDSISNGGGTGTVTSIGLSMPSAFTVSTPNPITTSGTFSVSGAGTTAQYIRGNGTLATFDTTAIPSFSTKVRSLFSGTSPIVYANGLVSILNANASGQKGAATFTNSDFSDNGSGTISLLNVVTAGSCTNCDITFDAKGRIRAATNGTGGGGGNTNSNIGTGYRWAVPLTNNIKTFNPSFGTLLDSTTAANTLTIKVDTTRSTGIPSYYYVDSSVAAGGGGGASANTYYVAQNGLSTGNGSTPATAINMARLITLSGSFVGGEHIFFKANDTLRGSLTVKSNTYVSRYDTGRAPIIAGTIRSTSVTWTQNGVIWSAPYATRVGRVLLNGIPQTTAQSDYYEVTSRPASDQVAATTATGLGSWVTDAEMISKEYNFRFKYNTITAYNSGTGAFTLNADNGISVGYSFKVFNHFELIDADGEWAWVDGVVYFRPPGNVNPNTLNVELSVYDNGLVFEDLGTNFVVKGVDFYAQAIQGINANKTNVIEIDNCNFYKQLDAGIFFNDSCTNISITNCQLDSIGSNGIMGGMEIKNFVFDNLSIKHIGTQVDPPFSRNDDITARNGVNGFGVMLFPNGNNGRITNCTVDSVAYIGLRADASNSLFQYNKVSNFSIRQNDAGGIYTWGNETSYYSIYGWRKTRNVTISNNTVWNGVGGNEGGPVQTSHAMGIYLDNGTVGAKVIGNTTYNNTGSGIYVGFDTEQHQIFGNVSYGNDEAQLRIANNTADGGVITNQLEVKDNILVALRSTSNCFLIFNSDGGTYNPFDSGYCINNVLVTPYTNNIVKTEATTYTLATARTFYSVNFGQQDVYSTSFVNDSIARVNVKIDVNLSPQARWSVMPENFRNPVNKYTNSILAPNVANVWVTASRDLTVNHNNGPTSMVLSKDNTERFLMGVANANDQIIVGSVSNDVGLRTPGGKVIISGDDGATPIATFAPAQVGIGTVSPSYLLDVQSNVDAARRINITNLSSASSAIAMIQAINNNDYGLQAGVVSSTYSSGFNGNNDVFFQANTQGDFNIMRAQSGNIRFGIWDGVSQVQEAMRINTSREIQIGSVTDAGAFTLQNTGGFYQSGTTRINLGSDATGDVYYRNSSGNLTRLGVGSDGDVLTLASGLPSWAAPSGGATTLYNGNGSLSGDRTVTGSNNDLTFASIGEYRINSDYFAWSKNNATRVYTAFINNGSADRFWFGYTPTGVGGFTQGTAYIVDTLNNIGLGGVTPTSTIPQYASGGNVLIHGLQSSSDNYYKVTNITTSQTIGVDAYFITVDATSGNVTITLPAASSFFGANMGICYVFKRLDNSGNSITVQRAGSDTIDGGTSFTLSTQYESKSLQCISTSAWAIFNQ